MNFSVVFSPDSRARTAWDFLLFLVTLTLAILGPLELVYKLNGKLFVLTQVCF